MAFENKRNLFFFNGLQTILKIADFPTWKCKMYLPVLACCFSYFEPIWYLANLTAPFIGYCVASLMKSAPTCYLQNLFPFLSFVVRDHFLGFLLIGISVRFKNLVSNLSAIFRFVSMMLKHNLRFFCLLEYISSVSVLGHFEILKVTVCDRFIPDSFGVPLLFQYRYSWVISAAHDYHVQT